MLPNDQSRPPKASGSGIPPRRPAPAHTGRKDTPPPPIVAYEDIVASCGHPEKFGLFEDRLDKFRRDRRKKAAGRPCKACRERRQQEEDEAAKVRRAEKQKRAQEAAMAAASAPKKKPTPDNAGRLPDGSKFDVVYDASKTHWTGTLTIGEKVFTGSASGLFTLLNRLDQQYRQTLPPEPPPPAS